MAKLRTNENNTRCSLAYIVGPSASSASSVRSLQSLWLHHTDARVRFVERNVERSEAGKFAACRCIGKCPLTVTLHFRSIPQDSLQTLLPPPLHCLAPPFLRRHAASFLAGSIDEIWRFNNADVKLFVANLINITCFITVHRVERGVWWFGDVWSNRAHLLDEMLHVYCNNWLSCSHVLQSPPPSHRHNVNPTYAIISTLCFVVFRISLLHLLLGLLNGCLDWLPGVLSVS